MPSTHLEFKLLKSPKGKELDYWTLSLWQWSPRPSPLHACAYVYKLYKSTCKIMYIKSCKYSSDTYYGFPCDMLLCNLTRLSQILHGQAQLQWVTDPIAAIGRWCSKSCEPRPALQGRVEDIKARQGRGISKSQR